MEGMARMLGRSAVGSRDASPTPSNRINTYRGHRRQSFMPIDNAELVELRARTRTDASYSRTALGMLSYSVIILKIFDRRFYRIGLLYVILAAALYLCAIIRRRKSRHDFADSTKGRPTPRWDESDLHPPRTDDETGTEAATKRKKDASALRKRIFGAPFVTAGWVVILVTATVATVEVALLVLLLEV
ncbi:hypothetical protein M407DRAFT_243749 [Tulasnella calospora MUT 4182]|uniref:DUF202 domain-containing protein n=1 Tax=Tulasnella calospora MUT 4182 TaxID=1051891 RepID=A0A0C3LY76_9AGAM|nr:hypothetical protein M407DRAFT_243749 [Tulasnella calospora MUT 4182]